MTRLSQSINKSKVTPKWAKVNSRKHSRHPEFISGSNQLTNQMKSEKRSIDRCRTLPCNSRFAREQEELKFGMTHEVKVLRKGFFLHLTSHFSLKSAFTLAEVLITLGIIGIVAAMTIPSLIQKTQNLEYVNTLKKGYTEISQAILNMQNDYNCVGDMNCTSLFDSGKTYVDWGDALVKYLNVSKNCDIQMNKGCMPKTVYNLDGTPADNPPCDTDQRYKFVLNDGISISTENMSSWGHPNCTGNGGYGVGTEGDGCARISFDINGPKGPNRIGRDNFWFDLRSNGKLAPETSYASYIINAGWQMKY